MLLMPGVAVVAINFRPKENAKSKRHPKRTENKILSTWNNQNYVHEPPLKGERQQQQQKPRESMKRKMMPLQTWKAHAAKSKSGVHILNDDDFGAAQRGACTPSPTPFSSNHVSSFVCATCFYYDTANRRVNGPKQSTVVASLTMWNEITTQ